MVLVGTGVLCIIHLTKPAGKDRSQRVWGLPLLQYPPPHPHTTLRLMNTWNLPRNVVIIILNVLLYTRRKLLIWYQSSRSTFFNTMMQYCHLEILSSTCHKISCSWRIAIGPDTDLVQFIAHNPLGLFRWGFPTQILCLLLVSSLMQTCEKYKCETSQPF